MENQKYEPTAVLIEKKYCQHLLSQKDWYVTETLKEHQVQNDLIHKESEKHTLVCDAKKPNRKRKLI